MFLSIIIPAYNAAGTIFNALESVKKQTVWGKNEIGNRKLDAGAMEVIVVDDASSDDTVAASRDCLKSSCFRFSSGGGSARGGQVFSLSSNSGPAAARNRGIKEARGEWVAFLDADDVWLPDKMETQMGLAAKHPEVAMWCGGVIAGRDGEKDETGPVIRQGPPPAENPAAEPAARCGAGLKPEKEENEAETSQQMHKWTCGESASGLSPPASLCEALRAGSQVSALRRLTLADFELSNPVATSTVMVKKAVLEVVGGFDESFRGPEDYDLWMRIAAKHHVMRIDAPLAGYRQTRGSLSMDAGTFLPQVLRVVDKAYGRGGVLEGRTGKRRARAYQYYCAAWSALSAGTKAMALRLSLRSFVECPWISGHSNMKSLRRLKLLWRILGTSQNTDEAGATLFRVNNSVTKGVFDE